MPATSRLFDGESVKIFSVISGAMKRMAKKPITTDGIEARTSTIGFTRRRVLGRAYSER